MSASWLRVDFCNARVRFANFRLGHGMMDSDKLKFSTFCDNPAVYDSAELYWDDFASEILSRTSSSAEWRLLPRTRTAAQTPWTEDGHCTMLSLLNEARKR